VSATPQQQTQTAAAPAPHKPAAGPAALQHCHHLLLELLLLHLLLHLLLPPLLLPAGL
jgi:hypothetical protein